MANILPFEKRVMVISALAEGNSIRGIERMTGINRNTIMNLGVRVGNACMAILSRLMRGVNCHEIEVDEIWGFIGKKQKQTTTEDRRAGLGDAWTFLAIDPVSKVIPCFHVGQRDAFSTPALS